MIAWSIWKTRETRSAPAINRDWKATQMMFLSRSKTIIIKLTEATAAEAHVERAHATSTRAARRITAPSSPRPRLNTLHSHHYIHFETLYLVYLINHYLLTNYSSHGGDTRRELLQNYLLLSYNIYNMIIFNKARVWNIIKVYDRSLVELGICRFVNKRRHR